MKEAATYEQETFATNGKHADRPSGTPNAPLRVPGSMKSAPILAAGSALIMLGIFAWYVWPTPYESYQESGTTIRINRFTGQTQSLQPTGWVETTPVPPTAVGKDILGALSVDSSLIRRGELHTRIYNGSNHKLTSVTLLLTVVGRDHSIKMTRPYLASPEDAGKGEAYTDSGFGTLCSVPLDQGDTYRVTVVGASGEAEPELAPVQVMASSNAAPRVASTTTPSAPIKPTKPSAALVAAVSQSRSIVLPTRPPVDPAVVASLPQRTLDASGSPARHSLPLDSGTVIPHTVPPFQSAIVAPRLKPLPPRPSVISPSVLVDPSNVSGLTPLEISSLQQRYDIYKRDGTFETDQKAQAWGLAVLARNLVHDDRKPDLSKVPTSILEDSLHMINTYTPKDFLRS